MKILIAVLALMMTSGAVAASCSPVLDHEVRRLGSDEKVNLCQAYQGKVVLIVNTASKCAYTDQYDSLEKLYSQYKDDGLVVLGFPSNDFGAQEPGSEQQIKSFCRLTYGIEFPMFAKSRVTRYNADPLYRSLASVSGQYPSWNFHKYLLDRNGEFVRDYASAVEPLSDAVLADIRRELSEQVAE